MKESHFSGEDNPIDINEITVIIPFRNEEKRINQLIESINNSIKLPKLFLFVNDHSSDSTVSTILNGLRCENYQIINLPVNELGKKKAILFGIQHAESEYILTMDADISFSPNYFNHLELPDKKDMYVLPVIMRTGSFRSGLFAMDHLIATILNTGLAGLSRPIMASGANFLFKKEKYLTFQRLESHVHIQSGDDTYLLRDFRNGNASVRLISHPGFAVETETPQNLKDLLQQRVRWIAKTKDMKDHLANIIGALQGIFSISFISFIIFYLVHGELKMAFVVYSSKVILDMFILLPTFNRYLKLKTWLLLPLYELIFPFYSMFLAILILIMKQEWKGRKQE